MLSKEAKKLIYDSEKNYIENKGPVQPLDLSAIRKRDLENAYAQSDVYKNTAVTTEDFFGTPVDVMVPKDKIRDEVFLYIHGGGWMFGSAVSARLMASFFTEKAGAIALCPDYGLFPENSFLQQLLDCHNAYVCAAERYGAKNIVLIGSSAGGNLSLRLMQKLRETPELYPKGVILCSPAADIDLMNNGGDGFLKYDTVLRGFPTKELLSYVNGETLDTLCGEYDGFPPMYICCGSEEALFFDSVKLYEKAKKSGVKAVLSVRAGMWHSYPECQHFIPEAEDELRNALSFIDDIDGTNF